MACHLLGTKSLSKQWNFNQNIKFFINENALEYIICEMTAIMPGGDE